MNFDDWLKRMVTAVSNESCLSEEEAEGIWKKILKVMRKSLKSISVKNNKRKKRKKEWDFLTM